MEPKQRRDDEHRWLLRTPSRGRTGSDSPVSAASIPDKSLTASAC
jgi:hypothetical protein